MGTNAQAQHDALPPCDATQRKSTTSRQPPTDLRHGPYTRPNAAAAAALNVPVQLAVRLCQYLRPKIHPLLLDAAINSPLTVRLNLYQVGASVRLVGLPAVCHARARCGTKVPRGMPPRGATEAWRWWRRVRGSGALLAALHKCCPHAPPLLSAELVASSQS